MLTNHAHENGRADKKRGPGSHLLRRAAQRERWAPLRTVYSCPGDQSAVCFERSLSVDTCEQDVALALPA